MFCNKCGHQNPPESNFCSSCGFPLVNVGDDATIVFHAVEAVEAEEELSAQLGELSHDDAMLVVRRGVNVGATYLLDSDLISVGRNPDSDIFLDDVTVSRRHAELFRYRGVFSVRDTGSLNGTYLNGERADSALLHGGDEVQIGKFKLQFLTGPVADE